MWVQCRCTPWDINYLSPHWHHLGAQSLALEPSSTGILFIFFQTWDIPICFKQVDQLLEHFSISILVYFLDYRSLKERSIEITVVLIPMWRAQRLGRILKVIFLPLAWTQLCLCLWFRWRRDCQQQEKLECSVCPAVKGGTAGAYK